MKHFTKEEQKKYTESIRKVFNLPEEYLRRADEKLPSDSKELKKDYLKLRSENTLLGERCNQLLTDKGKLTDRVQELEAENSTVWAMIKEKDKQIGGFEKLPRKVNELEAQIEKLIDFVLSKTECCDVCPITDTCINSEGTCPYAGILSKGEEAVTREWLMQKIAKEIKEK